jgi:RND family efflux transporter MFP subunit
MMLNPQAQPEPREQSTDLASDTAVHRDVPRPPSEERRRVASRLWRIGLPVALLAVGGFGYGILSREPAKPKPPPAKPQPVRTKVTEVRARDFQVEVRTHGIVRAHQESTLSALVSGRVARISESFEDGAFFAAGDVLVELEAADHRNAVAMAEARLSGAKAALQLARLNQERDAALLKENLLPQTQADLTAAGLAQAEADANSATAQLDRAQRDLERTQVRAPYDGCVRKRSVGLGQLVGPGASLGTVFSVDLVEARLPIATRELRFLELSDTASRPPVPVELHDAVDRGDTNIWRGQIIRTEGALDENSLELFAIARIEDPFGRRSGRPPLRLGQPVTAVIRGKILTNVIALPRAAVRELDRVYLVHPKELTLASRRITPLWSDEAHVVVRDPAILDGSLLATTHLVYAPEGARVEIIPDIPVMTNAPASTNGPAFTQTAAKP